MRLYFGSKGNLKYFDDDFVAATSGGHKLFIYAEFDTVVNTDLMVTVTFKRSDGFIVGPLPASEHIDDGGVLCRVVELNKQVLAVPGPLELTVRYDYYGSNELGEKVRVATRALAKTVAHVYDAVGGLPEEELGLYFLMDRVNVHDQKISSLENKQTTTRIVVDGEDVTSKAILTVELQEDYVPINGLAGFEGTTQPEPLANYSGDKPSTLTVYSGDGSPLTNYKAN